LEPGTSCPSNKNRGNEFLCERAELSGATVVFTYSFDSHEHATVKHDAIVANGHYINGTIAIASGSLEGYHDVGVWKELGRRDVVGWETSGRKQSQTLLYFNGCGASLDFERLELLLADLRRFLWPIFKKLGTAIRMGVNDSTLRRDG
jgi:hypothetical protein